MKKYWFIPFLLMGCIYVTKEVLWRGYSHWTMFIVGGLCGVLIDLLNERNKHMSMLLQSVIGAIITLAIEFASGLIVNVWLGWNIWDYSTEPFNILGQVCPQYGLIWFVIMPYVIWVADMIRWMLYRDRRRYDLIMNYKDLLHDVFELITIGRR